MRTPPCFHFFKIVRVLILSSFGIIFITRKYWTCLAELYLTDRFSDTEQSPPALIFIFDFHFPAIEEPDIAPPRAPADGNVTTTYRRARFHHGGDMVFATYKLIRMGKDYLSRFKQNNFLIGMDILNFKIKILWQGLFCAFCFKRFGAPKFFNTLPGVYVAKRRSICGFLHPIIMRTERYIIT